MGYRQLYVNTNEEIKPRLSLVKERIAEINREKRWMWQRNTEDILSAFRSFLRLRSVWALQLQKENSQG